MASYYLVPDSITYRGVEAHTESNVRADFSILLLHFDRPSTDFASGDTIYPSYDGEHVGLLETYQYTLIAANGISPIAQDDPVIVEGATNQYIQIQRRILSGYNYLNLFQETMQIGSFSFDGQATLGIAVGVFSDGVATFGVIENFYNSANPNPAFTYEAPLPSFSSGGNRKYGYMIASVADSGYAPLRMPAGMTISGSREYFADVLLGRSYVFSEDPYDNFPEPEDPGGDGNPDSMGPGDAIDIPDTPTISAASSGLVTLYNPSINQLQALAAYLWSGPFDLDSFKKIFADPMDCILGLSIVPVSVPNGAIRAITVGNISTGINVSTAAADYVEVDCGTLSVPHEFASYLDYAPFTTVDIYLPYIGVRHLDTDNIMPAGGESTRSIKVVYKVDLFSGGCIAFIKCGSSVMYSFAGQCATQIPVTGNSWTELYKSIVGVATSAIGSVTSGAGSGTTVSNTYGNAGRVSDVRSHISEMSGRKSTTSSGSSHSASAASVADAVFSAKPQIDRTGNIGSAIGLLGVQKPYLIIRRPVTCIPKYMNEYSPYPSYRIRKVGALTGHAVFEEIHLEHIPATEDEVDEIYSLLESGVII